MSCRVLKRGFEQVMLDFLVKNAIDGGITTLIGYYFKTKKNNMVKELYKNFGFTRISQKLEDTIWELKVDNYTPKGKFILVNEAK